MLDGKAFDIYAEDDLEKLSVDSKPIKRTKSAVRLINLLDNITSAYNLVPNIGQKFKFLVEIQLNLLGQYQKRLSTAIDSFEALSLIRSVPVPGALPDSVTGVMTATETGGTISALHRLYRWWTSARSIMDVLKDWAEDEVSMATLTILASINVFMCSSSLICNFESAMNQITSKRCHRITKEVTCCVCHA